ncbi:MAG: hypothetical protein IJQ21_13850 [Lachnospiraceae bacterium]|nr:hypothetical protein [Lachnospiraceae bacterium]
MSTEQIIHELQDMRHLAWTKIRHSSGTAGSFLKAYDDLRGKRVYYKLSDFDPVHGLTGHECVNEIIADRLLTLLRIEHVHYRLIHARIRIQDTEYTTWLCASDNFRAPDERKISLEDYYLSERKAKEQPMAFCKRMGWQRYIYEMLIVDYLILNRDRHGANMEVLVNRRDGSVRPAPLFDHGLSLVCRCQTEASLRGFDVMEDKKVQSFVGGNSASENLSLVPKSAMRRIPALQGADFHGLFEGLTDALGEAHRKVIQNMLEKRWEYFEMLRHS